MTVDLFKMFRELPSVKRVCNLPIGYPTPVTFLFFLCPALNAKGIRVNDSKTGVTGKYANKLSSSTIARLEMVEQFRADVRDYNIESRFVSVYATADSLIVFSPPAGPPSVPELPFPSVENHQAVHERLDLWHGFYQKEPWSKLQQKFVRPGVERLHTLLPENCPHHIRDDFVRRIFAGFALDGKIIRSGLFGPNPILLGVESPEIAVLQNAALGREDRIPVVQLA